MTDRRRGESTKHAGDDGPRVPPTGCSGLPQVGPLLAIDIGTKRIGLALSDPSQRLAHPLTTLHRRPGKRFPLVALREHIERHAPVGILIGLPLAPDGSEDERAQAARSTGAHITEKTGLPVDYRDERMTTARALRAVRDLGGRLRNRKGDVDPLAATTLLQSYLDSRR